MTSSSEAKFKLKKLLKELKGKKGRHTELVTVYVPQGYNINEIANQLKQEQGTAENIKSKPTRKNVVSALEKIIQHLKIYKKTPENGLAIFCGNVSEKEGQTDIQIWAVEPSEPLKNKLYWCDQKFELGPLEDMIKEKEIFGLIVLDKSEVNFALLKGKKIESLKHLESIVPGKSKAGGQSAARFERVREGMLQDFLKKVGENTKKVFAEYNVKGFIVGGPGPIKDEFVSKDYLPTDLKEKIIAIKNIGYTGEHGLEELIERSQDVLEEAAVAREKKLVQNFLELLKKGSNKVSYGLKEVKKALDMGAVEKLLISEDLEWKEVEYLCQCGWSGKLFEKEGEKQKCPKCGKELGKVGEMDLFTALEEKVGETGGKIELISRDTREGEQLYQLGGIAAFLRFKID